MSETSLRFTDFAALSIFVKLPQILRTMMRETLANWALSVCVCEIEVLKGLTIIGVPHIKYFHCVTMQIKEKNM